MSLQIPRRQYGIFVLDARTDRAAPTLEMLRQADFDPQHLTDVTALNEAIELRPPHVIMFHRSDEQNPVAETLVELRSRLPETHFIVLSSAGGLSATWREWGDLITDCVLTPPVHPRQLIQAILRAAERDAYMYRAEELADRLAAAEALLEQPMEPTVASAGLEAESSSRLSSSLSESIAHLESETAAFMSSVMANVGISADHPLETKPLVHSSLSGTNFDFAATWGRLIQAKQLDDLVHETIAALADQVECPVLFLRHLSNRRLLLTTAAYHLELATWKGLGLNLAEEPNFSLSDLRHPERLMGLKELTKSITQKEDLWVKALILREDVYGLFLIMQTPEDDQFHRLEAILQVANERGRLLDLQQYIHAIEILDPTTLVLNRATLTTRLNAEIARARRLHSPVSMLSISLDQYRDILTEYGLEEAQMAVRALTKIIQPRSRANDLLGRLNPEELGLILPHTTCEGATIKAERLRKLISAADFGRMLPRFSNLTVSVGVSEYPSCCRDTEDLITTADDALWQVKNKVKNKVCVSRPVLGFVPDFAVAGLE